MQMFVRFFLVAGLLSCLAGCSKGPKAEPIVIYVSEERAAEFAEVFDAFSEDTDIPVTLHIDESETNTSNVIKHRGAPPVDVLLTDSIAEIWRAADEGALRPVQSEHTDRLPSALRDPDQLWMALGLRRAVIVSNSSDTSSAPKDYADLASATLQGGLCVVSSNAPLNRALIAMLIDDEGVRPAELLVRGWMRNLALPPFTSDAELVAAVQAGTCKYGLVDERAAGDLTVIEPQKAYFDVAGVGIARHARYPDAAQQFLDWLLQASNLQVADDSKNIGIAGWRDAEAVLLAERAGYR